MNKPKRMIFGLIPNNKCDLQCEYCYISQLPDWLRISDEFKYDIDHIAKCLSPERLGGTCLINFTGEGETMLQPDLVDLSRKLLEQGHFLEIVTNLTITRVVDQFMEIPRNLLEQVEFKVSFHYAELKKKKLLNSFFNNLEKIQKSGCSFTLELMPYDDLEESIPEIMEVCKNKVGANCHVTVGRADYLTSRTVLTKKERSEYINTWSVFNSPMFDLKMKLVDKKRTEFCYAGAWTLNVNMYTGEACQCYSQPYRQNIFENPDKPIKFIPVGCHCAEPFCFNGHAHISFGVIPEIEAPTYLDIRNRKREDGSEWFSEKGKVFFGTKLSETNKQLTSMEKLWVNIGWYFRAIGFVFCNPQKVIKKIRVFAHKKRNSERQ